MGSDFKLYPHQREGIDFLKNRNNALLADEMGLGKTIMTIKALDELGLKRVLVICPSVAKINWQREFENFTDPTLNRPYEIMRKLEDRASNNPNNVVICSYTYATDSVNGLLHTETGQFPRPKWDAVVIDEAHFLKNPKAKRTKSILGRSGIQPSTDRLWLLSGSPAPSNASELWVMLRTFGRTFMDYDEFTAHFCHTRRTTYGLQIMGTNMKRVPELKKLLKPIMLRRLKENVLDLPKLTYGHITVEPGKVDLSKEQSFLKYFYPLDDTKFLKEDLQKEANLLLRVFNGTDHQQSSKDKQLPALEAVADSVATIRRYIGLQKVEPVVELVKRQLEDKEYEKIVIFALHRDVIEGLRVGLKKFNPVTLYGGTPAKKRQRNIDRFQNTYKYKVFIGNILAAGTAINLTRANRILFIEQDWVPGNNAQAVMRCHRIGQTQPVMCNFVALDNTIDSKIMFVLKKKIKELTEIFDKD